MKVGIVGGGITGLTSAYELIKKNHEVFVFESEEKLGGLAGSFTTSGWKWPLEEFFHHFFTSDSKVKELLREIKLDDKLFYKSVETSVYTQGKIFPFDTTVDFLKFPHLSLPQKLRMGFFIFLFRQLPFLPIFEKFTARDLFPKLIGNPSWEAIWGRLMEGKFGELGNDVSFAWLWSRIKKRSPKLGYIVGGSQTIFDTLTKEIKKKAKVFLDEPIEEIKLFEGQLKLKSEKKEIVVDKVILSLPLEKAIDLTEKQLPSGKIKQWRSLEMVGALTLILRLKNNFLPGKTYWLNFLEKEFPFIVLVEQTNFIDPSYYGGEHIVYVGGYYHPENPIFKWSKDKVFDFFAPHLRRLNPSFEKFLVDSHLFSSLYAQPVIPINYSRLKPPLELVQGKIYWANAFHIYPWDRGMNFCVEMGKKIAKLV